MTEHFPTESELTAQLAAHSQVEMPDRVTGRLARAIRHEVNERDVALAAGKAKQVYLELAERSALGTFGANGPKEYDRAGVGIELHDQNNHPEVTHPPLRD